MPQQRLVDLIREEVDAWDPHGLLGPDAAPDDPEYDPEVRSIAKGLQRVQVARDLSLLVSRVFTSSFGDPERFSVAACTPIASRLWTRVAARHPRRRPG